MGSKEHQSNNTDEYVVEQQFEKLYPNYDDSTKHMVHGKDLRRKKRMKTVD